MDRQAVTPTGLTSSAPYSLGIKAGGFLFVSGQVAREAETGRIPDGIEEQTRVSLENVKRVVEAAGSSMDQVVKVTVFLTDMKDFTKMNQVYRTFFSDDLPARSAIGVKELVRPEFIIEIEAIALL
ncbi:MAG: RidA family protein [Ardenticatenaceae bacterium]|nr:RidA family protein [Ardenticatenaceae bacterium]HBY94977.1 reactive intermediate/imine deaminase [Chloroflexota bacterium]